MKRFMKKLAVAMFVLVAAVTIAGTGISAEAATKKPTKITLTATTKTVDIKGTTTVSVKTVKPSGASKSVSFKSSNSKVAKVSTKGVVTGVKKGTATITATSKVNTKVKATIKITVKDLKPTSVTLSKTTLALNKGGTATLKATVKPAGVYCPVTWSSNKKTVATVSSNGKVTAKANGTATITVKTKQKNSKGKYLTKTCKVTVTTKVTGLSFATAEKTIKLGETYTAAPKVTPTTASNKKVTYASSNTKVATVDASGKVTALSVGETTITATAKDGSKKTASYKLTVYDRASEYNMSADEWKALGCTYEEMLEENMIILDIRPDIIAGTNVGYQDGYIEGSLHCPAFPVENAEQEAMLQKLVDDGSLNGTQKIAIICRTGNTGAKRSMSYLKEAGIDESRLTYLIGGGTQMIKEHGAELKVYDGGQDYPSANWASLGITYDQMDAAEQIILDIRPDTIEGTTYGYADGHVAGSVHCAVFPLTNAEQTQMLFDLLNSGALDGDKKIVVICRSGNAGAKNVMSYLKRHGVDESRLTYLIGGGNAMIQDHAADLVKSASKADVLAYASDSDENTVLVDARLADSYQGWALDGAEKGGHITNAVNISAQWLDCYYYSNKNENKTREESIEQELNANSMTTGKSYIVYDTNGIDAGAVVKYLKDKGYTNVVDYNAADLINSGSVALESYENYDVWVPAEVVKNISDNVVNKTALSEQAAAIVNGDPIVLLDVAWGDETSDPNTGSGYDAGHVPGAIHVNSDDYESPKVYVPEKDDDYESEWRLNSDEELFALAESKGITKDSCVIITGYEPLATTRMAIILKYLGCDNVHVMSEALVGWDAQGYAYETGINQPTAVASFGEPTENQPMNPDLIDTIEEAKTKLASDSNYQLIDTRTIEEWNGESSGYSYHDLAGRIEGTIHSPSGVGYSSSMYYYRNTDKSMRSQAVLEAMWAEQGIDTSKHMAFFCGSGWRAAEQVWDALALGYTDVSLYSDGWIGWSNEGNPYIDSNNDRVYYDKTQNAVVSAEYNYISADSLKADIQSASPVYTILDVRTASDYAAGHIVTAISADVDAAVKGGDDATATANLKAAIAGQAQDAKYVLVCYSGNSYAKAATRLLKELGVSNDNIITLTGGFGGKNAAEPNSTWKDTAYVISSDETYNYITAASLKADLDAASQLYKILDVRIASDYAAAHINGAVSADVDAAVSGGDDATATANLQSAIAGDTNVKYVLVCYSGNSYARAATRLLQGLGVSNDNIITLTGGFGGKNATEPNDTWKNTAYVTSK